MAQSYQVQDVMDYVSHVSILTEHALLSYPQPVAIPRAILTLGEVGPEFSLRRYPSRVHLKFS